MCKYVSHTHVNTRTQTEYIVVLTMHAKSAALLRVTAHRARLLFVCFVGTMWRVLLRKKLLHTLRPAKKLAVLADIPQCQNIKAKVQTLIKTDVRKMAF